MPSASAKLEKQASTEANDPIKQGITIIEHKIRNLEKRKSRLESYRDQQSAGKELNSDQLAAIAKYDEVQQTLEFARELSKQFNNISIETAKLQKKQARKEALEKQQQELAKVKEILVIQDVLANMGQDTVREDFLAGRNGAVKLTEEDLQHLDDLFTEVSPKRDGEDGLAPFAEQLQKAAEHLIFLTEGKNKEIIGTTYASLRQKIQEINSCGYFDTSSPDAVAPEAVSEPVVVDTAEEDVECEEDEPEHVPTTTFQSSKSTLPMAAIVTEPTEQTPASNLVIPPQPPVSEVISSVMSVGGSSFHFLQDSELDSPEVVAPTAPPASALPIPSQTFTNQSFVPPSQSYSQQQQQQQPPIPQTQTQQTQPQNVYPPIQHISGSQATFAAYTTAPPPQHQATYQQQPQQPQVQPPQPPPVERVSDWSDAPTTGSNVIESTDWNVVCEAAPENAWKHQKHQHQSDNSWGMNDSTSGHQHGNSDGFLPITGRGGSGRGGRGRGGGRGAPRGGGRNSSSGGGGFYRNNTSGGDSINSNYYQSNGFQNRNMSGDHKRGGSGAGGPRVGPGGPRSDRGGPRGGRGGRGSNRQ